MSLESPTIMERALAFVKAYRIWFIIGGLIVALLLIWWGITAGESWNSKRELNNLKANANASLQAVNAAHEKVIQDKTDEALAVDHAKQATNAFLAAANATDITKAQTNQALANMQADINANRPVGTTADDLQKQLDDLDK